MISSISRPQFVSKIFSDNNGHKFRLNFFVAIVNGELRAHLLSVQPISATTLSLPGGFSDVICLPIICSPVKHDTSYRSNLNIFVSPFFSLEFLINSQPTRAPAF
jgi:hypothetical protein